jgi:hypothetical protein
MALIALGACVMLAALALQLVMVIGVIEPALAPALLGYGTLFAGMFVALSGAVRRAQKRR